jgi:hypothetical protein
MCAPRQKKKKNTSSSISNQPPVISLLILESERLVWTKSKMVEENMGASHSFFFTKKNTKH